jgi:phosphoglycerate dehydrogenase-like enzyme
MMNVAILDDYQRVAKTTADWTRIADRADFTFFHDHISDQADLADRLRPFDAVVVMRERTPLSATTLRALPSLRLIVTSSPINRSIDMDAAAELGITICGTSSAHGLIATVELTWALILSLTRGIAVEDTALRRGSWQVGLGSMLNGKTLGIVGLGNVGCRIPPVAFSLGMQVAAWSRNMTESRAREFGASLLEREEFFRTCDVITVHIKLSPDSVGYIGAPELEIMKRSAFLVNTSRGPIVDESALIDALKSGSISGAALDVFNEEPIARSSPLLKCPNTLLTPHIGYVSRESYEQYYPQIVEDIECYLNGHPIRTIDPKNNH